MSQAFLGQTGRTLALTEHHKQVLALGTGSWVSPGRGWPQGTLGSFKEAGQVQTL